MRRNLIYSFVVFLLLFAYMCAGLLTQLVLGAERFEIVPFALGMILAVAAIISLLFFFVLRYVRMRFAVKPEDPYYRSSSRFVAVASALVAISLSFGVFKSYSDIGEKRQAEEAVKQTAEAEKKRLAAMTPEQRDAEAIRKDEQAKASARAAADEAARKALEEAKVKAEKAKRDTQLQMAGAGALTLKNAMKDPEAFELKSLVVKSNGTACYKYRAKNSFGATFPGSAVLSSKGKLLTHERDGNLFVAVWNKECTPAGGDEIADLVKRLGIL